MPVLVNDPLPAEMQALLDRRREIGADTHDEMWEGVLHLAPAPLIRHADIQAQLLVLLAPLAAAAGLRALADFNIGSHENYRAPDGGLWRAGPQQLYADTAALAIEIVSPGDRTWEKLGFYAAHGVDELLIVDPETHRIDWLALTDGDYQPVQHSGLIELGPATLVDQIDWPPAD